MSIDPRSVPPDRVDVAGVRRGLSLNDLALVAAGGAVGTLARVGLSGSLRWSPGSIPAATFIENISGAFLLGLVLTLFVERSIANRQTRLLVCTGVLGSFTTYSTLSSEIFALASAGSPELAAGYATATLGGGLAAATAGVALARMRRR